MRRLLWLLCVLPACKGESAKDSDSGTPEPVVDCAERPIATPSPRGEVGGAWDATHERFVVFGGDQGVPVQCSSQTDFVGETWAFQPDCDNFVQLSGGDGPKRRGRHATAGDGSHMWIHGGRFRAETSGLYDLFDDTWVFDFATDSWTELDAPGGPSKRTNHVAVVAGNKLYIYGGNASNDGLAFIPLGDTWALDLDTLAWTELQTRNNPPERLFHAAATDGSFLYVYAGGDEDAFFGPFFRDLWALDLTSLEWTEMSGGSDGPEGRIWPSLTYDPVLDQLVMFAGHDDQELGNHNELWSFDIGTSQWDRLKKGDTPNQPAGGFCDFPAEFTNVDLESPERRNGFASALTDAGELFVFGGKTDCGLINDVWSLDIAAGEWSNRVRASAGESCERANAACDALCF